MAEHLVFQIYGPLQSWGTVAVGEIRPSHPRPTRSGILGLVAGALGIGRQEDERLRALEQGYGMAVRCLRFGGMVKDYHTTQCGKRLAKRVYRTRADEVGGLIGRDEKVPAILSRREYLEDSAFAVCLWPLDDAPLGLDELAEALRNPVFTPYLGRKSCPPALPFNPHVAEHPDPLAALRAYPTEDMVLPAIAGDASDLAYLSEAVGEWEERADVRDAVLSRKRWQFGQRGEYRAALVPEKEEG